MQGVRCSRAGDRRNAYLPSLPPPRVFAAVALCVLGSLAGCAKTRVDTPTAPGAISTAPQAEVDPKKRAQIRLQLASTYYQQGRFNYAIEEARTALRSDPNLAVAYGLLGLVYMDLGDRAQAETNFARGLKIEPENPELLNNYGWYLCKTGRERESIDWFQRASTNRLYQTPGLPLQNAGICMYNVREFVAAEQFLKRAFEADASSPVVKYQLVRVYLDLGRTDQASFYYELLQRTVDATAETMWLGLRVARARGDTRTERQLADELRQRFPTSTEVDRLQRGQYDQ